MLGTVVHTPQSSTGVKPASPMVTSPTARRNRRSAPSSPTTQSGTRSGSKESKPHTPSKQSVTAALAFVRARKASFSPKFSPRDENGMTNPATAFWPDSSSPASKSNRLPLTPKMQSSPTEQLSSTPLKLPSSPPPSSPRSQASPMSSDRGSDNRSPNQKFFLNSFASRAHAPTLPALSIIAVGQENEGSDLGSPTSLNVSTPRRSRRAAVYRSRLSPRSPRPTLNSSESSALDAKSPTPNPYGIKGTSCVMEKANSKEEADTLDWHSAKEVGSEDSRSDAGSSSFSEERLDPEIQLSLSNFIDRLNDKEAGERPEDPATVATLSSSDEVASVDPETLKEIASFIDFVSKKPEGDQVDDDDDDEEIDSSFDEEVPAETRAGINAFIESLEKKALTPKNPSKEKESKGTALRVSSNDEDVRAARDVIMKARLSLSASDEIAFNRSDPFASPNPSNLVGEHLLQPGSSKVSAEDEANVSTDYIQNERNYNEGTSGNVVSSDISKSEEDDLFARTLLMARKVVQGAGDFDQHTEINGETIEIGLEDNSHEDAVVDETNAITSLNRSDSLTKADEKCEQDRHNIRANVSEDETSYMQNAFLTGSDMDLSIDPILHDPSTMRSFDEDDNIERFLARTFTLPEGATKEDLTILNSYVRQAGNMMQNGSTQEERDNLIKYAIRDGVPNDVTQEIFMWLASAPEDGHSAQETKSTDEEESFDRFLRETFAGEAEEPCVEEEVGTDVLRINDTFIEICDTFERFNGESRTKEAEQSFEEEVGSDMLTINDDSIEISYSFVRDLNTCDARNIVWDDEASDANVDIANRKKDTEKEKESIEELRADNHPNIGIEVSHRFLAASLSSAVSNTEKVNDETSYLFNAFVMGSDMDLSVDPIVPDPSTMKSIDEDDNIERFLTTTFTLPEGAAKEDLVTLNSYIRQAGNMMQNGSTPEERDALVKSAIRHGIPMDVSKEIDVWFDSSTKDCGVMPAKMVDEEIASDPYEGRGTFADPTLSEPSTSTSMTNFMNEQVESLLAKTTTDKSDTSTEGRTISLMDSFIDNLALREGASAEEIEHLNKFMKLAAPVLSGKSLSDKEEVEVRCAAKSIGISVNVMDEVLSENGSLKLSPSGRTSANTATIDLPILLAASSIEKSQDQTVEIIFDMGHSDMKNRVVSNADEEGEDGDGQVWLVEDSNGANPVHKSVFPQQQPSLSSRSTFDDPVGPSESERPDESEQHIEVGQVLFAEDSNEASFSEKRLTHSSHSTSDDHDRPLRSFRPDEKEQRIENFKKEDEAQTFGNEEEEEIQGLGFDYSVDKNVLPEQQRTLHKVTTVDYEGPLSPTIDRYELPLTPVNCTKEDARASFMPGLAVNVLETKVFMPQESGALASNLPAPPPPLSPPPFSPSTLETKVFMPQESGALASNFPAPPPPFSSPPFSPSTKVPQENERYALPPTPVSQKEDKIIATCLLAPPPPLSPPPISSKLRVVVPQGSEGYALTPTPVSLTEAKIVAGNLPTSPLSSSPASPMTRGHESERYTLPPMPASHVEENVVTVNLSVPPSPFSPFPDSPITRGQERERYALPPTSMSHMEEKTGAISPITPPPPSSPPPSSPKTKLVVPQSERYELPPTPVNRMEENPVVVGREATPTTLSLPQRRVAYAVHRESHHLSQLPSRKSKAPISSTVPPMLAGGTAAAAIAMWSSRTRKGRLHIPITQQWKLSYKERTKNHLGYFNVDEHSLHDTSAVMASPHVLDDVPWEDREVKQRFLHEHSVSLSRNWFGNLSRRRGNDRHREPVCHPKSMKMPMTRLPERDWEKEWYLTWQSQKLSHLAQSFDSSSSHASSGYSSASSDDDDLAGSIPSGSLHSRSFVSSVFTRDTQDAGGGGEEESDSDDGSWCDDEDAPECGYIVNVKQKIGERVSRIHPDYTSSLRRSRWRKKHFPRGTFPY